MWTTPSGRTYTTRPGGQLFFPQWNTTTAGLPPPRNDRSDSVNRTAMMPRRTYTRAEQWARQIRGERALNDAYLAERNKPPPG